VGYSIPLSLKAKRVINLNRKALRLPKSVLTPTLLMANHIFVESEFSLQNLRERFPKFKSKMSCLPPGVDSSGKTGSDL
jgi:hypothetical protein